MTNWINEDWSEQMFKVLEKYHSLGRVSKSRAAAVVVTPGEMMVANNPDRNRSKVTSVSSENKAKVIYDFLKSKLY
jgi:hypothetical protein